MKRIVTIQDISCVGRCSLTVALPVLSAMGVETAIIPTAVLSTHTAFQNFTFRDLTQDIAKISAHWKAEKITFDAVYTGYLGSFEQLQLVADFFDTYRTGSNLIAVDPAMGDLGRLYPGFTPQFAKAMAGLCGKADVIVPNLTEAACMLDIPYRAADYDESYVRDILRRLCALGAKKAVLTGISYRAGEIGVASLDAQTGQFNSYFNEKIDVAYHGTGDIFASCLVGALMNDFAFEEALAVAVDYTLECIRKTQADPDRRWYGVDFEAAIPYLIRRIGKQNI